MAHRLDDSCSTSSHGLPSVNLVRTGNVPEQWSLPQEWNIEKRELFANWKLDVQSQIANLDKKLKTSLNHHPNEAVEELRYQPLDDLSEDAQRQYLQSALRGHMQTGLRRS